MKPVLRRRSGVGVGGRGRGGLVGKVLAAMRSDVGFFGNLMTTEVTRKLLHGQFLCGFLMDWVSGVGARIAILGGQVAVSLY